MTTVIDESAEVVTTEKRRQYYLNPEPNFFMILTMSVPRKDTNATGVVTLIAKRFVKFPAKLGFKLNKIF